MRRKRITPLWGAVLAGACVLFVVFIVASVRMVNVAVSSQPGCVDHHRVGEREPLTSIAAKSAC